MRSPFNTSENLNFQLRYKGLWSEAEYLNQLLSTGNFRFTNSYNTKTNAILQKHIIMFQDICLKKRQQRWQVLTANE
jgi:hypothetical protein